MNKLLLSTSLVATVGTALLVTPPTANSEFDLPSLNNQVQNHEQRIGDLETKTDNTQTQVNQTVENVKVIQRVTETQDAPPVEPVVTPVATPPTPEPTDPKPKNGVRVCYPQPCPEPQQP